ncbi:MAG: dihydroorotate dehydrogenase-like protein [Pirellulales bacterium]
MTVDLSTRYLGLSLPSPLVVAACPLTGNVDSLKRLEAAGAAAAVLPSLFEEQIEHDEMAIQNLYDYQTEAVAESLTYFPDLDYYNTGTAGYLRRLAELREAVAMPLIGSLNGTTATGWAEHAKRVENAGADALELNIYIVPTDVKTAARDIVERYVEIVTNVRQALSIPLSVKLGPYFTALPNVCRRLVDAGAQGLVLFNRYLEPDINLETLEIEPHLELSRPGELLLPMRWIAILRDQIDASLAATSGIHSATDAIKVLLAGADVVMMASALLEHGPDHLDRMREEMVHWLGEHEYVSVEQLKGSMSRSNCPDPASFERANYMKALTSYTDQ